jgi:hypothetical protein
MEREQRQDLRSAQPPQQAGLAEPDFKIQPGRQIRLIRAFAGTIKSPPGDTGPVGLAISHHAW